MGQVYRARDTQLNRNVAIKVLPDLFAQDAERLTRFTREAQTLAALNHPNIAHIHGLEGDGSPAKPRALVMELVEGEDLSALIGRGPLPLADALTIARQIADAVETAHSHGIIHRDLKPANVKVRHDGTVKVLDFGLAKAIESPATSSDAMQSPTLTAPAFAQGFGGPGTQLGTILGTAAYMAPEQARGKAVDQRADIWAFGVILYEMLTGRRAFAGVDVSDVLASVLKSEPDWRAVPADTPASIRRLLRRCLEKEPRKRLSAIGDARLELDEIEPVTAAPATVPVRPSIVSRVWPALAAALLTAVGAALLWPRAPSTPPARAMRLSVLAPPGTQLYPESSAVALSPDGSMLAFVISTVQLSSTELWVRSLDSMSAKRFDGADGAALPFWSPDSKRIGFFTPGKLKTISVAGGRAETLADAPDGRGATWSGSNTIVFAPDASGPLYKIAATGGTPTPATTLDAQQYGHRLPVFLPDGRHFLFAALPAKAGRFDIFTASVDDPAATLVASLDNAPVYADPGWLLYSRQGTLAAQPFDPVARRVSGEPIMLPDEPSIILDPATAFTAGWTASVSGTGALAYFSSPATNTRASWYDAAGRLRGTLDLPPGNYESVAIAPDGRQAVLVKAISASESTLWLADLVRGGASPFSTGPGLNNTPIWSPDSTRVVFAADRDGAQDLFVKRVGDGSPEQPLYRSKAPFKKPSGWSPDGNWITVTQHDPDAAQNVWLLQADGKGEMKLLVRGPGRDVGGPLSPDGRWLSYTSDETGQIQLWVQSFPEPGRQTQVSTKSASLSWWTRDGRQILFLDQDRTHLWRADIEAGSTLRVGAPRLLATLGPNIVSMDAMPDRQRFLALTPERIAPGSITIVQNWLAGLRR